MAKPIVDIKPASGKLDWRMFSSLRSTWSSSAAKVTTPFVWLRGRGRGATERCLWLKGWGRRTARRPPRTALKSG